MRQNDGTKRFSYLWIKKVCVSLDSFGSRRFSYNIFGPKGLPHGTCMHARTHTPINTSLVVVLRARSTTLYSRMAKSAPYSFLLVAFVFAVVSARSSVAAFTSFVAGSTSSSVSIHSSTSSTAPSTRWPSTQHYLLASTNDSINGDDDATRIGEEASSRYKSRAKKRVAVLLCPAQFCVPLDYTELLDTIQSSLSSSSQHNVEIVATRVAPLPRTEWIKVAKQLPTKNFIDANLSVRVTLDWYFEAMERGLSELMAESGNNNDVEICVIGHSIGGWVARAYLGGLSGSSTAIYRLAKDRISSLITLGTPHSSPSSALVDQTRGW